MKIKNAFLNVHIHVVKENFDYRSVKDSKKLKIKQLPSETEPNQDTKRDSTQRKKIKQKEREREEGVMKQ